MDITRNEKKEIKERAEISNENKKQEKSRKKVFTVYIDQSYEKKHKYLFRPM